MINDISREMLLPWYLPHQTHKMIMLLWWEIEKTIQCFLYLEYPGLFLISETYAVIENTTIQIKIIIYGQIKVVFNNIHRSL